MGREEYCKQISLACVGSAQCLGHTGFAPTHGVCSFPVYTAQAPGLSAGELSKAHPGFCALPRSKLLRFSFSGTPQRHRLGWACVLCLSQVRAAQVTSWPAHCPRWSVCLISLGPATRFPGCAAGAPPQVCRVSPLGADIFSSSWFCCHLKFQNSPQTHWCEGFLVFGNVSSFTTPPLGWVPTPNSFVSLFVSYILSYLLPKRMGCLFGCLVSSASIQKLFCGICSPFKWSFDEFVGEKVVSPSYSSTILRLPQNLYFEGTSQHESPVKILTVWYDKTNSTQCNQSHMNLISSSFISKSVPVSHNTVITFEINRFMSPLFESCHVLCEAHLTKDRRQIPL